ncbi:MAG: PAS domain-containing sensor histidine kinase [Enhygromyxa sp.]
MANRNAFDRASEHELSHLRSCLAHAPTILAVADRAARYLWLYNPQAEFDPAQALGKTDLELDPHPCARALYELKRRVIETEMTCVEELELPGRGGPRAFEVTASPLIEDGVLIGVSTVGLDITTLREANEARTRLREEQLRLISHDLRQPLNVISLAASRLATVVEAGSPVGVLSECISSSVRAMTRVLEDILETGEWETGGVLLRREPTDVGAFLRETFTAGVTPDGLLRVRLEIDGPCVANIDRSKLGRAVLNLLDNALKFSPPEAPVLVRVSCGEGLLRIVVSDEGPGLDKQTAAQAFDKYQASPGSRASGGKGLGLYCARLIVEAHGGSCRVESGPGGGASFSIELPHPAPASAVDQRAG